MSKARLIITAVVDEHRTKSEVARAYDVSRYWVQQLVRRYAAEGEAAPEGDAAPEAEETAAEPEAEAEPAEAAEPESESSGESDAG